MARRYFGTDGVRGEVGQGCITPDFVMKLGQAAGRVLRRNSTASRVTVLIGKDTRVSGYMLESALQAGFNASGVDVVLSGPMPTPAIAYLTRALRFDAGVVISASHNGYQDNGIKFFSAQGTKLDDSFELSLEDEIDKGFSCVPSDRLGRAWRMEDARGRYIEFCKSTFPAKLNLRGLKIYLDCANGASYKVAPHVFHELGADVCVEGNSPDGFNINRGVGATHTEDLADRVRAAGCYIGCAFDGDADRLIMADNQGNVYNGDVLLYIMALGRMKHEKVEGVVGTVMTNYALEKRFEELGIGFARAKVGDRYVKEEMLVRGWNFGGESSGHLIALDRQSTGDGIVSALQVLAAIREEGKTLAEMTADLHLMPQILVNKRIPAGFDWQTDAAFQMSIEAAKKELGNRGRILIRASGTEPLVRVMVEADSKALASELAHRMADALIV